MMPGPPPQYPYLYPPQAPQRSVADLVMSIVMLVLAVAVGGLGAFMGLFMLAFLDHCPPQTCSVQGAVSAVLVSIGIVGAVVVVCLIVTVVALIRRKPGWPFALGALLGAIAVYGVGFLAFVSAVEG